MGKSIVCYFKENMRVILERATGVLTPMKAHVSAFFQWPHHVILGLYNQARLKAPSFKCLLFVLGEKVSSHIFPFILNLNIRDSHSVVPLTAETSHDRK